MESYEEQEFDKASSLLESHVGSDSDDDDDERTRRANNIPEEAEFTESKRSQEEKPMSALARELEKIKVTLPMVKVYACFLFDLFEQTK